MGLDQYAIKVTRHQNNTNFSYFWNSSENCTQQDFIDNCFPLAEWRKHPYLQGWMERLYNAKADRLGYTGIVSAGGMGDDIAIHVEQYDADGNPLPVDDDETVNRLKEVQLKIKEQLAKEKDGAPAERVFNQQPLRLSYSDLEQLETAINRGELPDSSGFFWGDDSSEYYKEQDLAFIAAAREAISNGYDVYYDSWW